MHILYVLGQSTGGLPHYTAELANAVAQYADVTVLKPTETTADGAFDSEIDLREPFAPLGISLPKIYRRTIDPREVLRGILSYRNLQQIPDLDPDIVHETTDLFPQVKFFMKLYDLDDRLPIVVTRHEVPREQFSLARPHDLAEEFVDAIIPDLNVSRTIVHTNNQRQALINRGLSPDDVAVIPHGTYSMFGGYEDVDFDPEPNTLLFFGHVVPHKGIDTLIRAIPIVACEIPDITLLVAGDGEIPDGVAHIVRENPSHFELHRRYIPNDEVKQFFGRAQTVVMPYHERQGGINGHSGALATAFSFGKPVITSRAGNFPSLVEREGTGRTVPSGDPERLAETIISVLRDDKARREMMANSRRLSEELSWDNIGKKHLDIYRQVNRGQ